MHKHSHRLNQPLTEHCPATTQANVAVVVVAVVVVVVVVVQEKGKGEKMIRTVFTLLKFPLNFFF